MNETINRDGAPTGNPLIDVLVSDGQWSNGTSGRINLTYSLMSGDDPYNFGIANGQTWTAEAANALAAVMKAWAAVANISFTKTTNTENANLWYWLGGDQDFDNGTLAWHELPTGFTAPPLYGSFNTDGDTWSSAALKPGGSAYYTILHELGHGLGLEHPHETGNAFPGVTSEFFDYGDGDQNQGIFTVMSYNPGYLSKFSNHESNSYGNSLTPMALDIAAIQQIYGANTSYRTGSDSYSLPGSNGTGTGWSCLWDAGGTDSISAGSTSRDAVIDLRAAPLVGNNAGGYVSSVSTIVGGFTIANGVVIERAYGGRGNDRITGNSADNILYGRDGNDTVSAGSGNDRLYGDLGDDRLAGSSGVDSVDYSTFSVDISVNLGSSSAQTTGAGRDTFSSIENLTTGSGDDRLTGSTLDNVLNSGSGNDLLYGSNGDDLFKSGSGNDVHSGGSGIDTADFSSFSKALKINLGSTSTQSTGGAGSDRFSSIENINGGSGADRLTGNSSTNILRGNAGDDTLDGGSGSDTLYGGTGSDTFYFNSSGDRAIEGTNQGTDTVRSTVSVSAFSSDDATAALIGTAIEKVFLSGSANAFITGNALANTLGGNAGANVVDGGDGNDLIFGGLGDDTLTGGAGADRFYFNSNLSALNIDNVTDFDATIDQITLNRAVFTGLAAGSTLTADQFVLGVSAGDTDDRIIFDNATGVLYFDADGSDAGDQIQFATLTVANGAVSESVFVIV